MKIKITRTQLEKIIKEAVTNWLDKPEVIEQYHNSKRYPLTEGLTCSYSAGKVRNILNRRYQLPQKDIKISILDQNKNSKTDYFQLMRGRDSKGNDFRTTQDTDSWAKIDIYFTNGIKGEKELVDGIIQTCDACGWFFANATYYERDENLSWQPVVIKNINYNDKQLMEQPITLSFRAKFNVEYKDKSIPKFLYHLAPLRVIDKIQKQGLTPRGNGRQEGHPERVYFFIDYPENWKDIAQQFKISGRDEPYALLEIDKEKINPNVKFYYDSNVFSSYPSAIYTMEPIPPQAIKIVQKEQIIEKSDDE